MRVLLADPDQSSRKLLRSMIAETSDMNVVAECVHADEIVQNIAALSVDLAIVDVKVPDISGFTAWYTKQEDKRTCVIMTGSNDHQAILALEFEALDFIPKPITYDQFTSSIARLRSYLSVVRQAGDNSELAGVIERLTERLSQTPSTKPRLADRLVIKVGAGYKIIKTSNIVYMKASHAYTDIAMISGETLHTKGQMNHFEAKLTPHMFVRVHRSFIVNLEHVCGMRTKVNDYELILSNGVAIASGFTYRNMIRKRLINGIQ